MKTSAKAVFAAVLLFASLGGVALGASKTYELDAFTAVDISNGIEARIEVGPAQSVRAESAREADLEDLIVTVENGKLHARTDWDILDIFAFAQRRITLHVTVPALDAAEASSGADIEVKGMSGEKVELESSSGADIEAQDVAGRVIRINLSSGADISVDGACGSADMDISSGATLRAERLACADVAVNASSGATARIFASASLRANASSGAAIEVSGKPASVDKEESSGGEIEIAD